MCASIAGASPVLGNWPLGVRTCLTNTRFASSTKRQHRYVTLGFAHRSGTRERLLSAEEHSAWASRLALLSAQLKGPIYFLWGTDWEDAPAVNAARLQAALPQRLKHDWKQAATAAATSRVGSIASLFMAAPASSKTCRAADVSSSMHASSLPLPSASASGDVCTVAEVQSRACAPGVCSTSDAAVAAGHTQPQQAPATANTQTMSELSSAGVGVQAVEPTGAGKDEMVHTALTSRHDRDVCALDARVSEGAITGRQRGGTVAVGNCAAQQVAHVHADLGGVPAELKETEGKRSGARLAAHDCCAARPAEGDTMVTARAKAGLTLDGVTRDAVLGAAHSAGEAERVDGMTSAIQGVPAAMGERTAGRALSMGGRSEVDSLEVSHAAVKSQRAARPGAGGQSIATAGAQALSRRAQADGSGSKKRRLSQTMLKSFFSTT
jgi:hypothetical protein